MFSLLIFSVQTNMPKHKKNTVPRSKGSTKPASSDAAAHFLLTKASSGAFGGAFEGTGVNLVGFGSVASTDASGTTEDAPTFVPAGYVPPVTGSEDIDATVDSELRQTLRRLSKKDAVTKQKALIELMALVDSKTTEALLGALPFWPALLSRLAIDEDWRVRECSHRVSGALGTRLGRELLPHLRHLVPWWLAGQCDPYEPVACAAEAAFTSIFNSEQRRCQATKLSAVESTEIATRLAMTAVPGVGAGEEAAARHAYLACVGLRMLGRVVAMPQVSNLTCILNLLSDKVSLLCSIVFNGFGLVVFFNFYSISHLSSRCTAAVQFDHLICTIVYAFQQCSLHCALSYLQVKALLDYEVP